MSTTPKPQINLLRGWPNPSLLPVPAIRAAAAAALSDPTVSTPGLLYGPDPGYEPLREEIAKWMRRFYSNHHPPTTAPAGPRKGENGPEENEQTGAERICITGGASQNLACVLQVFTDPLKTRVWMVAPCYFLACRMFSDAGLRVRAVPEGEEGIELDVLEKELKRCEEKDVKPLKHPRPWSKIYKHVIYCVPTFSNPSGKTMPLSQREGLVRLARKYDALILTDDVYDVLQWPATAPSPSSETKTLSQALLPRIVDIDRTMEPVPGPNDFGNAMSNGTFSKICGPGCRTGWAEATPKFTYGLSQCGSSRSGGAPSQIFATVMSEMLENGDLEKHIREVLIPAYRKRWEVMMQAIRNYLVPLGVRVAETSVQGENIYGGYFIWIDLPENMNAQEVTDRALESENLIVAPGHIFEVEDDENVEFPHSIRLCFSWEGERELEESIVRLARVVRDVKEGVATERIGQGLDKEKLKLNLGAFR